MQMVMAQKSLSVQRKRKEKNNMAKHTINSKFEALLRCIFPVMAFVSLLLLQSCDERKGITSTLPNPVGDPVLTCGIPEYDEGSQTFSLSLIGDSTGEAKVTFQLVDGDSIIMQSTDGTFSGIAPLDDGYNVVMIVERDDTTIIRTNHVQGFIVPRPPVEKMSSEELQQLINAKDASLKRGTNEHLVLSPELKVTDSRQKPKMLREVIRLIEYEDWKSVVVTSVEYDENNLISSITLHPIGEIIPSDDDEEYEEDGF